MKCDEKLRGSIWHRYDARFNANNFIGLRKKIKINFSYKKLPLGGLQEWLSPAINN